MTTNNYRRLQFSYADEGANGRTREKLRERYREKAIGLEQLAVGALRFDDRHIDFQSNSATTG
jgi:hypothetical protein